MGEWWVDAKTPQAALTSLRRQSTPAVPIKDTRRNGPRHEDTRESHNLQQARGRCRLMARIRTIKPEFWVDDVIVDLEPVAKLLYIGLWNFVDDEGYIEDSVRRIKMMIFPGNDYDVATALESLVESRRLIRMDSEQGPVLWVKHFTDHQKISHATPTKYTRIRPQGEPAPEDSGEFRSAPEPSVLRGREGKGIEGNGMESKGGETPDGSPSRRCPKHLTDDFPPSCGACKDARLNYERWEKAHAPKPPSTPRPPKQSELAPAKVCEQGIHKSDSEGMCLLCGQVIPKLRAVAS